MAENQDPAIPATPEGSSSRSVEEAVLAARQMEVASLGEATQAMLAATKELKETAERVVAEAAEGIKQIMVLRDELAATLEEERKRIEAEKAERLNLTPNKKGRTGLNRYLGQK